MSSSEGKYDIVVFGATGFTGEYVVEEIARTIEAEKLTWAVAGRNMAKLQKTLSSASQHTGLDLAETPILIADVANEASLREMCSRAKLVLNCVGPYRFFGDAVVKAAIEEGASHLDISGEPQFLENMQLKYDAKAKERNVYVIGACGWDSIPSEMGTIFVQDKFSGDCNHVENYTKFYSGPEGSCVNFGTFHSAIYGAAMSHELKPIRKQLFSTPLPRSKHKVPRRGVLHYSDVGKSWCVPLMGSDRSVVNRTQHLNFAKGVKPVQFMQYVCWGGLLSTLGLIVGAIMFGILANFKWGRWLLETFPSFFTLGAFSKKGPTRKQVAGTSFTMDFIGKGYSSKVALTEQHENAPDVTVRARVTGPDAGYISTPICFLQCAYALLNEKDNVPQGGGVLTPGYAFAKTKLIERLTKHNLKFELLDN